MTPPFAPFSSSVSVRLAPRWWLTSRRSSWTCGCSIFWKQLTKGKALWLRNNGSTLVSQLVDTSAVVLISHYGAHVLPVQPERSVLPQLISFIGSGYLFKVLAALTDTLPFIWLTGWLREWLDIPEEEGELTTEAPSSMHEGRIHSKLR